MYVFLSFFTVFSKEFFADYVDGITSYITGGECYNLSQLHLINLNMFTCFVQNFSNLLAVERNS